MSQKHTAFHSTDHKKMKKKKKKNLFVQLESWMKVMIIYHGIKLHFIGIYYHGMFKRSCFGTVQITLVYVHVWVLV